MKPSLQFRLAQQLTLTPQLQQAIRMLQMSSLELAHEVEQALRDNPFLERSDESHDSLGSGDFNAGGQKSQPGHDGPSEPSQDWKPGDWAKDPANDQTELAKDYAGTDHLANHLADHDVRQDELRASQVDLSQSEDDPKAWEQAAWELHPRQRAESDDEDRQRDWRSTEDLLSDHLRQQLLACHVTARDRALVQWLIDALNDHGMLGESIESIVESLPVEAGVEAEELQAALKLLQSFDPPGVGARDTAECLSIQLRQKPVDEVQGLALRVVNEQLESLARHDFVRLRRQLGCSEGLLQQAYRLVLSLNPRPASGFRGEEPLPFIVPEVAVKLIGKTWQAFLLRSSLPDVRLNEQYVQWLKQNKTIRADSTGLSDQVQSARWLIKNLKQRGDTILRVSRFIVEHQQRFFSLGEIAMRPLAMRMVAEALELHESTISRVTSQKYMLTPRGTFELKYFFTAQVGQESETEAAHSSTAIKARVKQIISGEAEDKPLSDSRIAEILSAEGSQVARRTVAKYRELLKIAPASHRRKRRI